MRIEQSYPSPIHGISTLAPRARPRGYASEQINFRSDPVNKLTRRPSSLYRQLIATVADPTQIQYHSYERAGQEFSFIVDKDAGEIHCAVDDVVINVIDLGAYAGTDLGLFSINHDTYVLNRDVVTTTDTATDALGLHKVSYVNITSALNYGESITLNITPAVGSVFSLTYVVPELGISSTPDYDAADTARATNTVAESLANAIIALVGATDVVAVALGSTIAIYDVNTFDTWIQVEVEAGQGDRTAVAINQVIESTAGLPLYAAVGTRITVRPDPTSEKGVYYLQAERIADDASGEILEQVVWAENRHPTEEHSLKDDTLPHKITYDGAVFVFSEVNWKSRQSGDQETTPFPEFIGKTIQTMGYFQKRLVVVSENAVYMTETDDVRNWFKQSAVQLLVNDPIGITTSEMGADIILHLVPHNRDLLVITSNAQFKISGAEAITPQSVSMSLTTKYECQVSVAPVAIGNSVFFPIDYGDSTGVQEYTGERETSQDFASPITNHIIGYLTGEATLFAASPNLEMLAMTTSTSAGNALFIYEQYTNSKGERVQSSWCEWEFADGEVIIDIKFRRNELIVLTAKGLDLVVKAIPMYTRVSTSPLEVYLDDMLILETGGPSVTVPAGYDTTGCIVVRGPGTPNELWEVEFTRVGDLLVFEEDLGVGTVYVGKKFTSRYEPTRPFIYDEDGSTITTDKVRVGSWILSLVDTHELSMTKNSTYTDSVTITFESRFVGSYPLGTITAFTGDWKFSFGEDALYATAVFFTDNYLGCTITDISWEGQYYKSKKRMN